FLCAELGLRGSSGVPSGFTLRLNQSTTATLTWTAPGNQTGYVLLALPLDGSSAPRAQNLAASATSATDTIGNAFTCYMLLVGLRGGLSNTDLACGLPGTAQFSTSAARTAAATSKTAGTRKGADTKQAQATAERLFKRKVAQVMAGPAQKLEQK